MLLCLNDGAAKDADLLYLSLNYKLNMICTIRYIHLGLKGLWFRLFFLLVFLGGSVSQHTVLC